MLIYVVGCPTCGEADCLEKNEDLFECECGEEFTIDEAKIIELKKE